MSLPLSLHCQFQALPTALPTRLEQDQNQAPLACKGEHFPTGCEGGAAKLEEEVPLADSPANSTGKRGSAGGRGPQGPGFGPGGPFPYYGFLTARSRDFVPPNKRGLKWPSTLKPRWSLCSSPIPEQHFNGGCCLQDLVDLCDPDQCSGILGAIQSKTPA